MTGTPEPTEQELEDALDALARFGQPPMVVARFQIGPEAIHSLSIHVAFRDDQRPQRLRAQSDDPAVEVLRSHKTLIAAGHIFEGNTAGNMDWWQWTFEVRNNGPRTAFVDLVR